MSVEFSLWHSSVTGELQLVDWLGLCVIIITYPAAVVLSAKSHHHNRKRKVNTVIHLLEI